MFSHVIMYIFDWVINSWLDIVHTFTESVTYEIGLNKGLIVFEYDAHERPSTASDFLAIGIQTILNKAYILRIDSADSEDFIEMELVCTNQLSLNSQEIKL